jgi:hypothetical protein
MTSPFSGYAQAPVGAPLGFLAITPADADLAVRLQGFRVGTTAGDVSVTDGRGVTTVIPLVQVGETVWGDIVRINATGTTAAGITGMV